MLRQATLGIIKPDIFRRANALQVIESIFSTLKREGFEVVHKKEMMMTIEQAEAFYSDHRGKFFYSRLVSSMTSGPIIPFVITRKDEGDTIKQWRSLMGPTHAVRARSEAPDSIRGHFSLSDTKNCVHGSDAPETAAREIKFFFPDLDLSKIA